MEKNIEVIGEKIAALRREQGLTQEALIEIIGDDRLSLSTLKRIEKGYSGLSVRRLSLVCNALGCDIRDIVTDDEDEKALKSFYGDPEEGEEDLIEALFADLQLFYPDSKVHPYYENDKITNLMQFLIYLPLFDKGILADCIERLDGDAFSRENYAMDLLKRLYRSIPNGDAKHYADMQASLCTREYFMEYHTNPETKWETELKKKDQLERFLRCHNAYVKVIQREQKVLSSLTDLKNSLDNR